jgi:hypothetical protein
VPPEPVSYPPPMIVRRPSGFIDPQRAVEDVEDEVARLDLDVGWVESTLQQP